MDTRTVDTSPFAAVTDMIRRRRTNLRIDLTRPVDLALLQELCELATWAPTHKRTEPWRFAIVTGASRAELGRLAAEYLESTGVTDEGILAKTRAKYSRGTALLCVASHSEPGADEHRRAEDRDAVSAGVQNVLLAATAAGLASYWGTGPVTYAPAVKALCGFDEGDTILSVVYLGWPIDHAPSPGRRPPSVRVLS